MVTTNFKNNHYSFVSDCYVSHRSQEACKLLTVQTEVARSLKRKLSAAQNSDNVNYDVAMTSLNELKIFNLIPSDANQVLSRRLLPE